MDEREKIKAALEQGSKAFSVYFRSELRKALDSGKGHFGTKDTEKTVVDFIADALIAENAELRARLEMAVELPVKVGDWVYCITDNRIIGGEVAKYILKNLIPQ